MQFKLTPQLSYWIEILSALFIVALITFFLEGEFTINFNVTPFLIVLVGAALISYFEDRDKKENWIRSSLYPVFTDQAIKEAYNEMIRLVKIRFPQSENKDKDFADRIKALRNPTEDKQLMEELKEHFEIILESDWSEKKYWFMIQANVDVLNGKTTIQKIEDSDEHFKYNNYFWVKPEEVEKEVLAYIDRVKK